MTPFYCSLAFPIKTINRQALEDQGWRSGVWVPQSSRLDRDARLAMYPGDATARKVLSRRHHRCPGVASESLNVVAAEVLELPPDPKRPSLRGYLVVHVEAQPDAPEEKAFQELAQLARPETARSQEILAEIAGSYRGGDVPWTLAKARRVPTIALSEVPEKDEGMVTWRRSASEDRRLASLLVLREERVEVPVPFKLEEDVPTPSYVVGASSTSTAIVRLRPVEVKHVERLRTLWTDVLLMELVQRETLTGLARQVREGAEGGTKAPWADLESEFRRWRTTEQWRVEADHPLELALSRRMRGELGTDGLVTRIASEIESHSAAARLRGDHAVTRAVVLLTVAAALVPLLLQLSQVGLARSEDLYFALAVVTSVGITAAALLSLRHG